MYQNLKGTFDILPALDANREGAHEAHAAAWQYVEQTVRTVMRRFGAEEVRTPIMEATELVARGVGEGTDIVTKEMFAFEREGTHYVLRPEVTAPVMRAYLQHHLQQRGGTQRLFYIGPCFRAEQPQKGRYRQFHQFGLEVIGSAEPRADAETIACMLAVYETLGIEGTRLRINTLGEADARARYREALRSFAEPLRSQLTDAGRRRLDKNPLRLLDTKDESEQALLADAPLITEYVTEESRAHYEEVKRLLELADIQYEEDPRLVRGLDYYTRTTFELEHDALGAQSALGAGGRYDGLAEALGASHRVPAVGFAAGFERLFLALEEAGLPLPGDPPPHGFLVALGDEAQRWAFATAQQLRRRGLRVGLDLKGRSMKAQMREANRQDAPYAVIVGGHELEAGEAQLKRMATGEQRAIAFDAIAAALQPEAAQDRAASTA